MGLKTMIAKMFASRVVAKQKKWASTPVLTQQKVLNSLIEGAKHTAFGKDHNFENIKTYEDFKKEVPIRTYEDLKPYVERILAGENDILWKGKPIYFAKTSGTTSGAKYIPLTKESIPNHINGARNALLTYIHETGKAEFINKKLIFLSGSPVLDSKGHILTGRLSGIVNHHVPNYLRRNQLPSYDTNCIDDWEDKLEKVIDETIDQDMSLISGIPPWVQMYFDRIQERSNGKTISEVFPNFSLFVYGGVNFEPYRDKLFNSIGKNIDSIELFPASEGFFAFQDEQADKGMLLILDAGIFYEFIPAEEYFDENPTRLSIGQVELHKNYALIINSNAGLWGYSIGDTVQFVSKSPYKVIVSGRIKHFISAFGEHVIGSEVEKTMRHALEHHPETEIVEFTVAPQVNPKEGLPHHEWLISFSKMPNDLKAFSKCLDDKLRQLNIYYEDLIGGAILSTLKITALKPDAFIQYMKSKGKLGGQNKVPRLSNDRNIADIISQWKV